MTREILRMPSQYAVNHATFPVNQRYFHLVVIQKDCHAAKITIQIHGIRRVHRETFVQIHERLLRHIILEKLNPWISNVTDDTLVLTRTVGPVTCGERQIPDTVLNPRFKTGASAGNSFDRKEGRFSNTYGADQ